MRIKVFYHDKCFDGACSAALFTRFYRERIREQAEFEYQGLVHRAGALFDEADFTGDENAIVDFKYSASPRITWWFDHHQSAFLTPEDASHFEQEQSNTKFYDPDFRSCTKFIAVVTEQRFGFDPKPVADTIEWADIIDGALYDDAKSAVEMKAPASRLTMLIESNQDPQFIPSLIPKLAYQPAGRDHRRAGDRRSTARLAGAASPVDRNHARARRVQGRHHLLRRHRSRSGGLQQVRALLSVSRGRVQRGAQQEQLPDEGLGGIESVDAPRPTWRTWRRSASATAAEDTRAWERFRSRRIALTKPAKRRG